MNRLVVLLLAFSPLPALAADITCPDMATARQVGECPSEQELKWGFTGYCGDNARIYDKANPDGDTCVSMDNYRKLKDVALWEAGEFQGYLHCARPPEAHKNAKSIQLGVGKIGALTRIVCTYEGSGDLSMRTRAKCRAEGDKAVCED